MNDKILYPNCSEATYKVKNLTKLKDIVSFVKKFIGNKRLVLDIGSLDISIDKSFWKGEKEIKLDKMKDFIKEVRAIVPKDKSNIYAATSKWEDEFGDFSIGEKREKVIESFEKVVSIAEFYRKWIVKQYPDIRYEDIFYITIHRLRIFPDECMYSDNDITARWNEDGEWELEIAIESHIEEDEFKDMENEVKKYVKDLELIERC